MRFTALIKDDGSQLDAEFEVDRSVIDIVLHSRSGSNPPRNPDYFAALELLLSRLAQNRAVIEDILVDSTVALKLPIADRRLKLDFPIDPAAHGDLTALRQQICSAQRTVAQRPGTKGGNNHKRIRIRVVLASGFAEQWLSGR